MEEVLTNNYNDMIIVANRRRKQEKLLQEYPEAIVEGIKRKTERHVSYTTPLIG